MKFKTLFFISFAATALMIAIMIVQGAPLKIPDITSAGIINMEFARTVLNATAINKAWSPLLISTAFNNIYIDFVFIISYSCFLFIVCYKITKQSSGSLKKVGRYYVMQLWWQLFLMYLKTY